MSETETETTAPAEAWYCPACGLRFAEPGTHDVGHAPVELLPLGQVAESTTVAAVPPAGAAPTTGPSQQAAAAEEPTEATVAAPDTAPALSALQTALGHVQSAIDALARL